MRFAATLVRAIIGPLFIGHGTQKLFGWFGGHGLAGTSQFFEGNLGLRPGRRHATAAGAAETAGGVLLTLGALTPVATTLVSATMITAIRKVHVKNGPWVTDGGFEYNAVLVGAMAMLAENGPGALSVDERRFPRMHGPALAALSLGAAAVGSYLATSEAMAGGPAAPEPQEQPQVAGDPASNGSAEFPEHAHA